MQSNVCDKCGCPVEPWNDAAIYDVYLRGDDFSKIILASGGCRHLLPVPGCEGSPSRAQYLPGQGGDSRPGATYHKGEESVRRDAYSRMLESERRLGHDCSVG